MALSRHFSHKYDVDWRLELLSPLRSRCIVVACIMLKKTPLLSSSVINSTFFNIVQATTIMLTNYGTKDAKRQSTSYVCDDCYTTKSVDWRRFTHYRWVDNMDEEDMP